MRASEVFYRVRTHGGGTLSLFGARGNPVAEYGFNAFHGAKMSSQDTQLNTMSCNSQTILYLQRPVVRTCVFAYT